LIKLGAPALWYDEAYTVRQIQRSYLEQFEGYQPFYYWVQKPWTAVAGTSEWALRFPSVVGAMLACGLLVVLAAKLFDRRVAMLSGLFLATSPYFVKWSQQARVYPLLVAGSLLATLLLLRALERGSRGAWALYGVAFTGVLVTHAVVGILLAPAHAVLIAQRRQRVMPHGLLAALVVVGIGLPWVAQLAMRTADEGSETAWIPFPSAGEAMRALATVSGVAGLGLLLAVAGIVILARAREGGLAVWLATWAFAPWAVALLVSTVRPIFLDRYLVIAAPAFAMLASVAVLGVASRLRPVVLTAAVVATSVGLVLWYSSDDDGNWRGEDWRGAVETVLDRRAEADEIVVVPWWAHDAPEYYGARASDVATADSVWVLQWSEEDHGLPPDVRGLRSHQRVEMLQFGRRVSAQLWVREP
jgi:mannosyltransferase